MIYSVDVSRIAARSHDLKLQLEALEETVTQGTTDGFYRIALTTTWSVVFVTYFLKCLGAEQEKALDREKDSLSGTHLQVFVKPYLRQKLVL